MPMMGRPARISMVLVLLIGLPLFGVWLGGDPVGRYLEFPPRTSYVAHEPFSWPVFTGLSVLVCLTVGPFLLRVLVSNHRPSAIGAREGGRSIEHPLPLSPFPWWGWMGTVWTVLWWMLAWTRVPWMASWQDHTFTPLWLGFIVVVNAWTCSRTGRCMMLHRPLYFLSLFPVSAAFWWFFEYLNRFVQNWYYVDVAELSAAAYVLRATLPFSTVLPAVLGAAELLRSFPCMSAGLAAFAPVRSVNGKPFGWSLLVAACAGLCGVGLWPNYLFPIVWLGPLMLIVSVQTLAGQRTVLTPIELGDWRGIWVPAIAALVCGWWWELWNWKSLAHWQYALPFVHRFQIFEMPVLGYAGYLPFGLECVAVVELCLGDRSFVGVDESPSASSGSTRV
jgi:hypothetical protein